jgi:predicted aspartyl protease
MGLRTAALAACLSLACWRGPVPAPLAPVAVVPFDAYGGAIYIPAVINGDSLWLMLDTGLSRTGLDRDWAESVGIVPRTAPGAAPAAPVAPPAATAVVDTIRIGQLKLASHRVALYPLNGLSEASGRLQRGLVGHDVLQHYAVEIDYRQRRVRLFDAARYRYAGAGTTVRFTADADLPLLRAHVKARGRRSIPARLLLDTGASGLCLILTTPFAEQHGLHRVVPAIEAPIGTGLVGELHGTIVRLQELRLGGLTVRSPTTGLGGEYKGFLARTDIDGVIGNSAFEGSRLIVDPAGRRAIVEPRPTDASPCDYDMSGLRLAARGPGLRHIVVDYVVPRSPSAEAGIAVGDELLRIDGRDVAEGDLSDARQALRADGAMRQLVLRRDADTIRVAVKLRRLL